MKIDRVIIQRANGKKKAVTRVRTDRGTVVVFTKLLSDAEARTRVQKYERNPGAFRSRKIRGLEEAKKKFKEFNWRAPRKLLRRKVDLSVPFIEIGKVPMITYTSRKEGSLRAYKHETKVMPKLYAHPSKPIFIMIGGSTKVKDWLRG